MPQDQKGGGSLTKTIGTVLVVIAAFLVLKFVIGVAMSVLKWLIIAAVVVVAVWLFTGRSEGGGKGGGG